MCAHLYFGASSIFSPSRTYSAVCFICFSGVKNNWFFRQALLALGSHIRQKKNENTRKTQWNKAKNSHQSKRITIYTPTYKQNIRVKYFAYNKSFSGV